MSYNSTVPPRWSTDVPACLGTVSRQQGKIIPSRTFRMYAPPPPSYNPSNNVPAAIPLAHPVALGPVVSSTLYPQWPAPNTVDGARAWHFLHPPRVPRSSMESDVTSESRGRASGAAASGTAAGRCPHRRTRWSGGAGSAARPVAALAS